MPLVLIILAVGLIMFFYYQFKSDDTVQQTSNAANVRANSAPPVKQLDKNNPYDICCALACLATAIGYYRSDSCCYLYVRTHSEKNETTISATFEPSISEIGDYRGLYIPEYISSLLASLSYSTPQKDRIEIVLPDRCISTSHAMDEIRKGISMVDGKPYICNLKSYHPGNNSAYTCIDYTAAD